MPKSAAARRRLPTKTLKDVKADDNPRPYKRQRIQSDTSDSDHQNPASELTTLPPNSSPSRSAQCVNKSTPEQDSKSIPPAVLLVSLPSLLAHPPNHRFYIHSLMLSLTALRKCLALPALSPDIECRAWTGLAELGMRVISGGLSQNEDHVWARGTESEVEKALSRGSIIAQKHPSLRAHWMVLI